MEKQVNKPFKASTAGPKGERKAARDARKNNPNAVGNSKERPVSNPTNNPKAFIWNSRQKMMRRMHRTAEMQERSVHVPMVDRTPQVAPPFVVAVVGPPKSGKTTLIKSLVKKYTKHKLAEVKGPITVVSGRKSRLTLIECPNDLNSMIDVGKVADLVLLTVDASFGFEMETFEFLNILQTHGFPRVMGVLTHLDKFRKLKRLRKTKKILKQRFWTEIYQGAKLFYLSGVIGGRYPVREIANLCRFISIMKFRPLAWRNQHPYLLADRMEDLTDPNLIQADPKVDRTVTLYGYLRGTNLQPNTRVHIPGAGDYTVETVAMLNDPCPLPDKVRKSLSGKQKLIYAPMSDVGGVMYDKDAVYINVPGSFTRNGIVPDRRPGQDSDASEAEENGGEVSGSEHDGSGSSSDDDDEDRRGKTPAGREEEFLPSSDRYNQVQDIGRGGIGEKMVIDLQDASATFADQMQDASIQIFSHSAPLKSQVAGDDESDYTDDGEGGSDDEQGFDDSDDDNDDEAAEGDDDGVATGRPSRRARRRFEAEAEPADGSESQEELAFADTDEELESSGAEDDDAYTDGAARWKAGLVDRAAESFKLINRRINLMDLVYRPELVADRFPKGYGSSSEASSESDGAEGSDGSDDELLKPKYDTTALHSALSVVDTCKASIKAERLAVWDDEGALESLRHRFITAPVDTGETEEADDAEAGSDAESELMGDFEDLEAPNGADSRLDDDESNDDGDDSVDGDETVVDGSDSDAEPKPTPVDEDLDDVKAREALARRKAELTSKFELEVEGIYESDDEAGGPGRGRLGLYDRVKSDMAKQRSRNEAEFAEDSAELRAMVEGYRAGTYVRVLLHRVPCEFVKHFNPKFPVVVGGLLPSESNFGLIRVRIKRHRWHRRILKNNDPLIFSLGWRRFQSLPLFSIDDGARNRMLKYTPQHMHCLATFYGPLTAPGTGFCCVESVGRDSRYSPEFRITATGTVLDLDQSTYVVKKLKLTGVPEKIDRNTAVVRGMFHSALEVAKFTGAKLRTVSGVRGHIRKHLAKPEGHFRAVFEDRIRKSDIVFLRAWHRVEPKRYYNPVTSLLLAGKKADWQGMRLVRDVRRERGIPVPSQADSEYRAITRTHQPAVPLKVPKAVVDNLPFDMRPKLTHREAAKSAKRNKDGSGHSASSVAAEARTTAATRAVFHEPEGQRSAVQLERVRIVHDGTVEKRAKRRAEQAELRHAKRQKEEAVSQAIAKRRMKEFIKVNDIQQRKRVARSGQGSK
ncbi:Glycoside hydrolase 2 (Mannanase, beta-galactosidase) [Tieghemiomyces parasiticus]|uniref:Glycoside hydrolase 2 (Mannanase, beta-galactosidase) n=1 Tax=Tieghemiomyces parasiticus TaxID=78921 RepID=A0A9W8E0E8_9FUNG|nr:Glycoside hydrolase 2 (Mannanase, beta-galactosidase) [Tieghemiomyces parasiticus]